MLYARWPAMTGLNLRALLWAALIALALPGSASAAASAADPGDRFDAMIADAKATMLIDPAKTIAKAKAAETAAAALSARERTTGIATAKWLQGEAYLRLNNAKSAKSLI